MAIHSGPNISENGLVLHLDASNAKSYPGSGTSWTDLSGVNSSSTLFNGVTFSSNNLGIFLLDGTNDYVEFPFNLSYVPALSNFSLEIWVKISSFPTAAPTPNGFGSVTKTGVLMGAAYYSGVALYWRGNASGTVCNVYAFIRGNDLYRPTTSYSLPLNSWTNLVLVNNYSSSLFQYYVNGNLFNQVAGPTQEYNSGLTPTAGNLKINHPQIDSGGQDVYSYLTCDCSCAKVYLKALSASEVRQNFKALRGRFGV